MDSRIIIAIVVCCISISIIAGLAIGGVFSPTPPSPTLPTTTPTTTPTPAPAPTLSAPAPTPAPTSSTPAPAACNTNSCNNVMNDWINNKYWAFGDSANSFGECKSCASRWFKAPFQISKDGTTWVNNPDRASAYNAVKLS